MSEVVFMMKFTTAKTFETNADRAKARGFKEAPMLDGYFYPWQVCVDNLEDNIKRTKRNEPPRLRLLFLETLRSCNLRCPMCYTDAPFIEMKKTDKDNIKLLGCTNTLVRIGLQEMRTVVRAAKNAGCEVVAIAGNGEPLLDPNFWEICEFIREQDLKILVFVNGTLVTPEIARRLEQMCNTIITKFFALEPKTHDILVGIKGEYVKIRHGLMNLLETGMRAPRLGIDLVITKQNETELPNILRMCRMLSIIPYFERMALVGRAAHLNGNIVVAEERVDQIFMQLREIDETEFGITWGFRPNMPALANAETDKRMIAAHVDVFGNIRPGLATDYILGNMRDTEGGAMEIFWNPKIWHEYYKKILVDIGVETN